MTDRSMRLCVLGDLDSVHTRRWMQPFVERGYDVHAISYYPPAASLDERIEQHVLRPGDTSQPAQAGPSSSVGKAARLAPPSLLRLVNAFRYRRAGLGDTLRRIQPGVLHAHYVVEYGFFAAFSGYHPLLVTAWGSDILRDAVSSPFARQVARYTLHKADAVTTNGEYMTRLVHALGTPKEKASTVVFGTDRFFLEGGDASVNRREGTASPPTIISTRSLDSPLYNVDAVLRATAVVRRRFPDVRLLIAGSGRLQPRLQRLASDLKLSDAVSFLGFLNQEGLRAAFHSAHVYVSVPDSDATSVSTLSAMAAGCFPLLSDLPTQREWVEDGANGLLAVPGDVKGLAERIVEAIESDALRRSAAEANVRIVEERGLWEKNVPRVESIYAALAATATAE